MYANSQKVRAAEIFENGSIVCTVNSFTSDEMKPYDDAKGNDYDSHRRYRTVLDSFSSERIKDEYIETTEHLLKVIMGLCANMMMSQILKQFGVQYLI